MLVLRSELYLLPRKSHELVAWCCGASARSITSATKPAWVLCHLRKTRVSTIGNHRCIQKDTWTSLSKIFSYQIIAVLFFVSVRPRLMTGCVFQVVKDGKRVVLRANRTLLRKAVENKAWEKRTVRAGRRTRCRMGVIVTAVSSLPTSARRRCHFARLLIQIVMCSTTCLNKMFALCRSAKLINSRLQAEVLGT